MNWKHWIVMVVAGSVVAAALSPGAQATNIRDVIEDYQACTIAAMVLIFVDLMPVEGGIAWGLCQLELGTALRDYTLECLQNWPPAWRDFDPQSPQFIDPGPGMIYVPVFPQDPRAPPQPFDWTTMPWTSVQVNYRCY